MSQFGMKEGIVKEMRKRKMWLLRERERQKELKLSSKAWGDWRGGGWEFVVPKSAFVEARGTEEGPFLRPPD